LILAYNPAPVLTPGTRVGPYEVVGPLGAGGMGEVYRARDPRLGREVAIKALSAEVAQNPERRARFEREAQLLASLNHPNIATIHGLEESGGAKYLVLELVDGRTLGEVQRAAAGALPVDEVLSIASQIAEALVAAHERGIIHRDLKPGNVMVTAEGQIKVLDFGLGKSLDSEVSRSGDTPSPGMHSPTMTMAATQAGLILGTAGYMSPEQAKGRPADRRSDVWGFGCLLYEMLAGRRAFDGEDVTEILAHVVRGEPDWQALPSTVPSFLRTLTQRCLVKDRAQRLSDMSVVRYLLHEPPSHAPSLPAAAAGARAVRWPVVAGVVAAAIILTAGAMRVLSPAPPAMDERVTHLSIVLPPGDELTTTNMRPIALSPDGRSIAYVARDGASAPKLYLRALDRSDPTALEGTEGAVSPFFSPDGRWIAFFSQGKLKKVTVGGTAVQTIADAFDARGGSWAKDDTIYFAPTGASALMKVAASGGPAAPFTTLDRPHGEISHREPHVLPDGKTLLFTIWRGPGPDEREVVRQSIATGERASLVRGGDGAQFATPGYLLYGRHDGLFAVPWRPEQSGLAGAVPVTLPETPRLENEGFSDYSVASDGTLAYLPGGPSRLARQPVWVDRAGSAEPLPLPEREYEAVAISPDGRLAALQIQDATIGLWLYDFARRTLTPFATTGGSSQAPVWSPDGKQIFYRGTRGGYRNVYRKAVDGTQPEERMTTSEETVETPTSVSPDGRWLVFSELGAMRGSGTFANVMPLDGDRTPRQLLQLGEFNGHVSPDGRWIVYQSIASGQSEIYVQPFPGPGPRTQISAGGGVAPRWSSDGRELFFESLDKFMAVDVGSGATFSAGTPRVLYEERYFPSLNANTSYDVATDGRRFLRVRRAGSDVGVTRIDVVLSWFGELRHAAAGTAGTP
jgi:serine/threonine-protein kinase